MSATGNIDGTLKDCNLRRSLRTKKQLVSHQPVDTDENDENDDEYEVVCRKDDTEMAAFKTKKRKPRQKLSDDNPRKRVQKPRGKAGEWAQMTSNGPPGFYFQDTFCAITCAHTPLDECSVLIMLNIVWNPVLGVFVCSIHHQVLITSELPGHVLRKHLGRRLIKNATKEEKSVPDHLIKAYSVSLRGFEKATFIESPIEQLLPPMPAYGCPESTCGVWVQAGGLPNDAAGIKHHCRHEKPHKDDRKFQAKYGRPESEVKITYERRFVQWSLPECRMKKGRLAFILPGDWLPSGDFNEPTKTPQIPRPMAMSSPDAQHLHNIGWIQYRKELGDFSQQKLLELIELPSEDIVSRFAIRDKKRRAWIEHGLVNLLKVAEVYFKSATSLKSPGYSQPYAGTIRRFKFPRNRFTSLNAKVYKAYTRPIVRGASMLIRWAHLTERKIDRSYGDFKVKAASRQLLAAHQLCLLFLEAQGGDIHLPKLEELGHNLFDSFLRQDVPGSNKVACSVDQTLFLMALLPEERFRSAVFISTTCAAIDYFLWATFLHTTTLKAAGITAYSSAIAFFSTADEANTVEYDNTPDYQDDEAIEISREELLEVIDDQSQGENDDQIEDDDDGSDEEEIVSDATSEEYLERVKHRIEVLLDDIGLSVPDAHKYSYDTGTISRIVGEEQHWLATIVDEGTICMNPSQRVNYVWQQVRSVAARERQNLDTHVILNAHSLEIFRSGDTSPAKFDLITWRFMCTDILSTLRAAINSLLPRDSLKIPFQWEKFSDNLLDDVSIFRQAQNREWYDAYCLSISDMFFSPNETQYGVISLKTLAVDADASHRWLAQEKYVLGLFATAFSLCCGITPSHGQFKGLKIDCTPTNPRSLFILDHEPAFALPLKSHSKYDPQTASTWSIPPGMHRETFLLLGPCRRIGAQLLQQLCYSNMEAYETRVFTSTFSLLGRPDKLVEKSIPKQIEQTTLEKFKLLLGCTLQRQVAHELLRSQFPTLFQEAVDSVADKQAQHRRQTAAQHYGQLRNIPSFITTSYEEAYLLMAKSRIYQAMVGLRDFDEGWRAMAVNASKFKLFIHETLALDQARHLINTHYKIGGEDPIVVQASIKKLMIDKPFLAKGSSIGDEVLLVVTRCLFFGPGRSTDSSYSICDEIYPTFAVSKIMQAVGEWISGHHIHLVNFDPEVNEGLFNIYKEAKVCFNTARVESPAAWQEFSQQLCKTAVSSHDIQRQQCALACLQKISM